MKKTKGQRPQFTLNNFFLKCLCYEENQRERASIYTQQNLESVYVMKKTKGRRPQFTLKKILKVFNVMKKTKGRQP
jgi:hypothetical protein